MSEGTQNLWKKTGAVNGGAAVTDTHFVWDGVAMVSWKNTEGDA